MSKLYIVCVIYNIKIDEIASIKNLKSVINDTDDINIIIMDNSDNPSIKSFNFDISTKYRDISYISNDENLGISKCFNKAVSLIEDREAWIMFADDDTNISTTYLKNLINTIDFTKAEIISGIVHSGNKVMSPLKCIKLFNDKENFIYSSGKYTNIYCINSCLCVKRSVFDTVRYNEKLFLDLADFMFMEELKDNRMNNIEIVEGEINQNFSGDIRTNIRSSLKRYKIYRKDFKTFCKLTKRSNIFMYSMLLKHRLRILITSKYF